MEDDLFQSLGGSLMKDLLADLQGDNGEGDGWLSLEQLEKELSQLDSGEPTTTTTTPSPFASLPLPPVPSAASMVVSGQQQFQQQQQQQQAIQGVGLLGQVTVTKQAPADAWKESLQKFTALSLDQDFLAADTVRKQQAAHKPAVAPSLPPGFLAEAQDYDATEKATLKPPPGLLSGGGGGGGPPPGMPKAAEATASAGTTTASSKEHEDLAATLASALLPGAIPPSIPGKKPMPKTPSNSVVIQEGANISGAKKKLPPKTPRNSVIIASEAEAAVVAVNVKEEDDDDDDIPMMGKVSIKSEEEKATQQEQQQSLPTKTPRNSVVVPNQEAAAAAIVAASAAAQGMAMPPPQMMPQGMPLPQGMHPHHMMPPHGFPQGMPHPGMMKGMPPQGMHPQGMHPQGMHPQGMPPQGMHPQGMPPQGMPRQGMPPQGMPPQGMHPQGMPPHMQGMPPQQMGMPPPHMMGGAVPMGMRMPTQGPAWQRPPPPPQQPRPMPPMRAFCNPHPNAPPIPAQALESKMMKSRDISYIIHSILKPVLMAGFSENDYDIQLLYRQSGARPAGPRPVMFRGAAASRKADSNSEATTSNPVQQEMQSREKKSKDWSTKNAALGHIPKANVARPRALIASPVMASQDNSSESKSKTEQKMRARLWKARIYCDQAYQAYLTVVDIWAKAAPGSVPPQVQAPLIKLMKCLGIAPESTDDGSAATATTAGDFKVDPLVLQLFLKLSKGRVLMARIVEHALLPPSAVQAVLPTTLDILYKTPRQQEDPTDDRCFRALTSVVQTLPSLSGEAMMQCAEVMKGNSQAALSSTCRMECLHALLQRGTGMAGSPEAGDFAGQWKETESSFMAILSGM